jgi:tetratricopeptide (TPR) repeat protein
VVSLLVGDHDVEAAALVERLEKLAADGSRLDPAAIAQVHRARAYLAYYADDLSGAAHEFEATIGAFERASDVRNACLQQTNLGYLYCELGQYESAERIQRSALSAGERMGVEEVVGGAVHNLGLALLHLGRLAEARRIATRAAQIYQRQRDPRLECTSRYYVARVALKEGDVASAEREARLAANLLSTAHTARSPALAALALALLAQGRTEEAESAAREAVQIVASSQRFIEGEPFSRLALAEVLHAAGNQNAAQAVIVKATHRLFERAKKVSDQRLRASFLERVPEHARTLELMKEWGAAPGDLGLRP